MNKVVLLLFLCVVSKCHESDMIESEIDEYITAVSTYYHERHTRASHNRITFYIRIINLNEK